MREALSAIRGPASHPMPAQPVALIPPLGPAPPSSSSRSCSSSVGTHSISTGSSRATVSCCLYLSPPHALFFKEIITMFLLNNRLSPSDWPFPSPLPVPSPTNVVKGSLCASAALGTGQARHSPCPLGASDPLEYSGAYP